MQLKALQELFQVVAPMELAEKWDNCGLQIGDQNQIVSTILVTLDIHKDVITEAKDLGAELILSHHPLIFKPLKSIDAGTWMGQIIGDLVRNHINLVALHTNLDSATAGLNARFARLIGVPDSQPIQPQITTVRMGDCSEIVDLQGYVDRVHHQFPKADLRLTGDARRRVKKVACCSGSGGSMIGIVAEAGADCFVSGDLSYHDFQLAERLGMAAIDVGHYACESLLMDDFCLSLPQLFADLGIHELKIIRSKCEIDPVYQVRAARIAPTRVWNEIRV